MIEAMKQALEALERYSGVDQRACDAEDALRQAIEQAEKQELVAGEWIVLHESVEKLKEIGWNDSAIDKANTPQSQREWVGLTHQEVAELLERGDVAESNEKVGWYVLPYSFARAIEAKLKEKNT